MATLRNRIKLAAISRETPENTGNNQSQNTLNPGMAEDYITQVSEEIEGRLTKKLSQEFRRRESQILGALPKLDEFLLNLQVTSSDSFRSCSGKIQEQQLRNQEPTGDRSLNDPCPEVVFSFCHTSNLIDSEQEKTHHRC